MYTLEKNGTNMLNELIKKRMSPRAFADKEIETGKIELLFEAARWAPSAMNEQPWRFIVAPGNNKSEFAKMVGILHESNQIWAKNAALLVLVIAKSTYSLNDKPNIYSFYDAGFAVANITYQAASMDLYVHQMGGFDRLKAKNTFHIPDDYLPVSILAIGYKGDVNSLPENLRLREISRRNRKPLNALVFEESFGSAWTEIENINHEIYEN